MTEQINDQAEQPMRTAKTSEILDCAKQTVIYMGSLIPDDIKDRDGFFRRALNAIIEVGRPLDRT